MVRTSPTASLVSDCDRFLVQLVACGRGDGEIHPRGGEGEAQAPGHVVAIPDVSQRQAVQAALVFVNGQQIGHCLAGMFPIGQRIDHWHGGIPGQVLQVLVSKYPGNDAVDVPRQDPSHVGDRLPDSQAYFITSHVQGVPAQLLHRNLEADLGPQRGLLEQQCHRLACQRAMAAPRLAQGGPLYDCPRLLRRQVGDGYKVPFVVHFSPIRCLMLLESPYLFKLKGRRNCSEFRCWNKR